MKIALVLSRPPGYSETFFSNKIKFIQSCGYEIEIYVDQYDSNFKLCPQKVLPKQKLFALFSAFLNTLFNNPLRLVKLIIIELRAGAGIIETLKKCYASMHLLNSKGLNWIHFGFTTMALGRENVASVIGTRMAVSFRGYDISRYPLRFPGVYSKLWNKLDKAHTISYALAGKAKELGMLDSTEVVRITPAIDPIEFKCDIAETEFPAVIRFTTVARLHWSKGIEHTLEALAVLSQKGIFYTYTIVGDGQELERLILAATQLGIINQIRFIGKAEHSEIKNYLRNTDIYIQYSVQEGFCNAVLEAQGCGLLCIVSDAEGLPENILHEYSGWVVPRRSPELLAQKIIEVKNMDSRKLFQIRQQAVARVNNLFNLEKQKKEFQIFYSANTFS